MPTATHNRAPVDHYESFVEGQTVRLIVGGPRCVIIDTCDDCGMATIAYGTSDGDIDALDVPFEALVHSD